jgi:phosphate transport system permease protein
MRLGTRKLLDRSFSGLGIISIVLLALSLLIILGPIIVGGTSAFVFRATADWRLMMAEKYDYGDREAAEAEMTEAQEARRPVYDMLNTFEEELEKEEEQLEADWRRNPSEEWKARERKLQQYRQWYETLEEQVRELLGPFPGEERPPLHYDQYGQTRWDRALVKVRFVLNREAWVADPSKPEEKILHQTFIPREKDFKDTSLEPLFPYIENNLDAMMRPRWTFYWAFLFHTSKDDAHFFGGIWPEVLGTFYLTVGAMIFAIPMGVVAAIYLVEYAPDNWFIGLLRTCISTLAGVPSIVFGLFGLAFFINALHVSRWFAEESQGTSTKCVLAGSLTLAILVLPIIIRAAEEAIRAVPAAYKEAALSLGASRWRTVITVILPAALPGILTGIVISMGRAAGETAPIMFIAAVSLGQPISPAETLTQPTPALPWNIYNLAAENQRFDDIRHVQYGMVLTLVSLVLILNGAALILRARISKKLRG